MNVDFCKKCGAVASIYYIDFGTGDFLCPECYFEEDEEDEELDEEDDYDFE